MPYTLSVLRNQKRFLLFIALVLLLSPISMIGGTSDYELIETVETEDVLVDAYQSISDIFSTSGIGLDVGEDPANAILLTFVPDGPNTVSNTTSSLNSTVSSIWFKFLLEESAFTAIQLNLLPKDNRPEGIDIDFVVYDDEINYLIAGVEPAQYDENLGFQAPYTGLYYLEAFLLSGFDTDNQFELLIIREQAGQIKEPSIKIIESLGHEQTLDIWEYVTDSGYIDSVTQAVSVSNLDQDDPNFIKGLALSINGLIRAGESAANRKIAGGNDAFEALNVFMPYFIAAENLLAEINNTRITDTGIYYIDDVGPNVDVSLRENVYALFSMLEIWQVYNGYLSSIGFQPNFAKSTAVFSNANDTMQAIVDVFYNSTNSIYVENEIVVKIDGSKVGILDENVNLESIALFTQVLGSFKHASSSMGGAFSYFNQIEGNQTINYNFINTNLRNTTMDFTNLRSVGLGMEYYNINTSEGANFASLTSQLYLLDIMTPQEGNNEVYLTTNPTNVQIASDLAYNIMKAYYMPNGLPVSQINTNTGDKSDTTNTYEVSLMMSSLFRVGAKWRRLEALGFTALGVDEIARTWFKAGLDLFENLQAFLYDDDNVAYFAQYDHPTSTVYLVDTNLETNGFVANAALMDYLSTSFPYQVFMEVEKELEVDRDSVAIIKVNVVHMTGSWVYYNLETNSTVTATISSTQIGFSETTNVDLNVFDFDTGFIPFGFTPETRGSAAINLLLEQEGQRVLYGSIDTTIFGHIRPEFNGVEFQIYTDDTTFESSISLIDDEGKAISDLEVETTLFGDVDFIQSQPEYRSKYYSKDRTDASGEIDFTFNTKSIVNDFSLEFDEEFIWIPVFVNVTNADSFNFRMDRPIIIELRIRLASLNAIISPSFLEIVQGSDDDYSFSVSVVNQENDPVSLARVFYDLNGKINSITTATDGSGTITLKGADLYAIEPPFTNITFTLSHPSYPESTVSKFIHVIPNSIVIIANPVQVEARGKAFFESTVSKVSLEVATEDRFGQTVTANVSLSWADPEGIDYDLNTELGSHISPFTFELDPAKLPEGEYEILVKAERFGLGEEVVTRRIIISTPSLYEAAASAILIYGAWILMKLLGMSTGLVTNIFGITKSCPNCSTKTSRKNKVCHACGNIMPGKRISGPSYEAKEGVKIRTKTEDKVAKAEPKKEVSKKEIFEELPEWEKEDKLATEDTKEFFEKADKEASKNVETSDMFSDLPEWPDEEENEE